MRAVEANGEHTPCPTIEELAELLSAARGQGAAMGRLAWGRGLRHGEHPIDACSTCRANLETLGAWYEEVGHPDPVVAAREHPRARELWRAMEEIPTSRLDETFDLDRGALLWAFASLLMARSREAATYSPERAVVLAHLATMVAVLLEGENYGRRLVAEQQARAFAHLGNARRIAGDLEGAEREFGTALRWLARGSGAPLPRAVVLDLLSSLRKDQRQLVEALRLMEQAAALYRQADAPRLEGKMLIGAAYVAELLGDFDTAIAQLTRSLRLIGGDDSYLRACVEHNLITQLIAKGQYEEAGLRLPRIRSWLALNGYQVELIRSRWLEARLLLGRRDFEGAYELFQEIRARFAGLELIYDRAIVNLDLAAVLAHQGRFEELKEVAVEALAILRAHRVPAEAVKALDLLVRAVEAERATVETVRAVADFLARFKQDARLRFVAAPMPADANAD